MPNGFGFETLPQRPSPDPRKVGAELARARFQMPSPGRVAQLTTQRPDATAVNPGAAPNPPVFDPDQWTPPGTDRLHMMFRALADRGGHETSGGGQTGTGSAPAGQPDYPVADNEAHSAMHAAIGAAATRLANGVMRNSQVGEGQRNRRRAHLLHLGMSPFEADLLSRSGGV